MSVDSIVITTGSQLLYWNPIKTRFISIINAQEKENRGDIYRR